MVWLVFTCGMAGIYRPQLECKIRTTRGAVQIVHCATLLVFFYSSNVQSYKSLCWKPYQIYIFVHLCNTAYDFVHLSGLQCAWSTKVGWLVMGGEIWQRTLQFRLIREIPTDNTLHIFTDTHRQAAVNS